MAHVPKNPAIAMRDGVSPSCVALPRMKAPPWPLRVTPATPPPALCAFLAFSSAILVASLKVFTVLAVPPSAATLNNASSALSICSRGLTSSLVSSALSTMLRPTVISSRSSARS